MFALHSRGLRRRLSAPSSASLRRRAIDQLQADRTAHNADHFARQYNELRQRINLESYSSNRFEEGTYAPWGRAGGGAPNQNGIRFTKIRDEGIIPEDELRGVQLKEITCNWGSPLHRRRGRHAPRRIREDPQCYYADNLRKNIDDHVRYRQTPQQKREYREILDDMVQKRQKALNDEMRKNLEYEQKMHQMEPPWGKPGPGGTSWRNPRDIGLNFAKSMGWTDNEVLNTMNGDDQPLKGSSPTLPQVKSVDDSYKQYLIERENLLRSSGDKLPDSILPDTIDKLPEIGHTNSANMRDRKLFSGRRELRPIISSVKGKRSPVKSKFGKRLSIGDEYRRGVDRAYPVEFYDRSPVVREAVCSERKVTPEDNILSMTGGVELVPLLARRRRVGARTLHSSDVTRPPAQPCEWREMIDAEYLNILKHQMMVKCQQKEDKRVDSAESVRRHHATWASLWGRPGHGAPQQRGRYARSNLTRLLYASPHTQPAYQNI